jgi:spermidine synthase
MLIILVILSILWGRGTIKKTTSQIYETESSYNYIQVLEENGYRYLRLNEGQGVHSIYHPEKMIFYGPWMQVLSAPFFNNFPHKPGQVKRIAIVGLAAGTIARQVTEVFGPVPIDGYEIDPKIIQIGQDFFDMNMPNLNAVAVDGRMGLLRNNQQYSIISLDAYRPPYIPWHMTTKEFFQIVYSRLSEDGVLVINIGRAPDDRRLIEGLAGTISCVFPSLYVMDIPDTFNSIVYATKQPTTISNIYENYNDLVATDSVHPFLLTALQRTIENIVVQPKTEVVFTDDIAPIEWLTNSMILNFILFGGVEELQ